MNSLALTDALLVLSAAFLICQAQGNIGVRLASAVLTLAAVLGVLRFSEWLPLPGPHQFMVTMSSSAAIPLLALASLQSESAIARSRQIAWVFLIVSATTGLILTAALGIKLYAQAIAVLSVLALIAGMARRRDWWPTGAGVCMLLGMILFVSKVNLPSVLVPGDFLHLGMAAGLLMLWPTHPAQRSPVAGAA